MREIKFRAIDRNSGKWVYGIPFTFKENNFTDFEAIHVCDSTGYWRIVQIIPDTLCQYTGLKDKNGKEIFEGDVVRTHFSFGHEVTQEPFIIKWNKERAMFEGSKPKPLENDYLVTFSFFPEQRFLYEIIGNIHDNPELLGVHP